MNHEARVQLFAALLYCAIIMRMDKEKGFLMAAGWYLRGAHLMRDVSNWAGTTAIRWENAAKELVAP